MKNMRSACLSGRREPPALSGRRQPPALSGRREPPALSGRREPPALSGRREPPAAVRASHRPQTSHNRPPAPRGHMPVGIGPPWLQRLARMVSPQLQKNWPITGVGHDEFKLATEKQTWQIGRRMRERDSFPPVNGVPTQQALSMGLPRGFGVGMGGPEACAYRSGAGGLRLPLRAVPTLPIFLSLATSRRLGWSLRCRVWLREYRSTHPQW
jgi:hypothetical protein